MLGCFLVVCSAVNVGLHDVVIVEVTLNGGWACVVEDVFYLDVFRRIVM